MRLNNFLSLLAAVTMTVALSMGCQKDKDPDRLAFLGSYTVIEACSITGNHEYQMIITESTTEENDIVVVIPKGAAILQSVINLKQLQQGEAVV